ncbi:MAG: hypothetical protein M0036_11905 [Desulfobacteraceae bacterium]|nr:hypothetical protein [Desulfobacteraceae bacterium]
MIANKKTFSKGVILMILFSIVLVAMFMPLFNGQNGLQTMDNLYNSISKGSAYYIPKADKTISKLSGQPVEVTIKLKSAEQAEQTARLFNAGGAMVNVNAETLKVAGDFTTLFKNCLADAKLMYDNNGDAVQSKYGYDPRRVMFNWWQASSKMEEELNKQSQFNKAAAVHSVMTKAIEPAYNYFGIQGQKIKDRLGVVIFSLVFYVIYTMWYGFAILYMFEGWGLQLEH